MSVLVCPVCQGAMREVNRQGVLIDTCTQCRGVWLDRGELEKLSAVVGDVGAGGFMPAAAGMPPRRDDGWPRQPDRYRDDDDDRHREHGRSRKSKASRFLDFFD